MLVSPTPVLALPHDVLRHEFGLYLEPDSNSDHQLSPEILNPSGG